MSEVIVPPQKYRKGPPENREDAVYIRKAEIFVNSILQLMNISTMGEDRSAAFAGKRLLDIGCGPLRLITGMQSLGLEYGSYTGIDVERPMVEWAQEQVNDARHTIHCLDMENARYNPGGKKVQRVDLPVENGVFDLVVLRSVFTHMEMEDIALYVEEIGAKLARGGEAYMSIYVTEQSVLDEKGQREFDASEGKGALHKQMVSRQWFEQCLADAGMDVVCFCPSILRQPTYLVRKAMDA